MIIAISSPTDKQGLTATGFNYMIEQIVEKTGFTGDVEHGRRYGWKDDILVIDFDRGHLETWPQGLRKMTHYMTPSWNRIEQVVYLKAIFELVKSAKEKMSAPYPMHQQTITSLVWAIDHHLPGWAAFADKHDNITLRHKRTGYQKQFIFLLEDL